MDKSVNAFFEFYEDAEVGEVANLCGMLRADGIFHLNSLPRVFLELLDAEAHLAFLAVEGEDDGLYLVAHVHELLC